MKTQNSHSLFFSALEERGHELEFQLAGATEGQISLEIYGKRAWDNLVLFAPQWEEDEGVLDSTMIMDFLNQGGNVLATGGVGLGSGMRQFGADCGIDWDEDGAQVIDHFHFSEGMGGSDPHTVIQSRSLGPALSSTSARTHVVGEYTPPTHGPVLYRGIGHAVDESNILALQILTGNPTTYSAFADEAVGEYPQNAGKDTLLVTALQARNNARATFAGSLHMFSNKYFLSKLPSGEAAGNRVFCTELSKWAFSERGVLRASGITHHREDGTDPELLLKPKERPDLPISLYPDPEITRESLVYRVKDNVTYTVNIEEYNGSEWVGYVADDIQLEFVMLDPYIRTDLTCADQKTGLYSATFQVPDVYGVFKFRLQYRRPGLTTLGFSTQVSVRPFKHNEYERFIDAAFPYYASAFSVMAGFFVFSFFFLYSDKKE
eukprot:CAMPEP_0113934304 /NCGR_PEP_ID=MMETSP1339-20121228/1637_1 /TAXON_ID=94617 /ORGANISM="Fibrocapsa japonica" /LENGTH=433 /DNA_ID=CAMNT_0000936047 /DNA_START=226 /DNA_END=1527 /DNA_ORIENTATION=+ /assembly_acc=CAM_ASM_000762